MKVNKSITPNTVRFTGTVGSGKTQLLAQSVAEKLGFKPLKDTFDQTVKREELGKKLLAEVSKDDFDFKAIKKLVKQGAHVNIQNDNGATVLDVFNARRASYASRFLKRSYFGSTSLKALTKDSYAKKLEKLYSLLRKKGAATSAELRIFDSMSRAFNSAMAGTTAYTTTQMHMNPQIVALTSLSGAAFLNSTRLLSRKNNSKISDKDLEALKEATDRHALMHGSITEHETPHDTKNLPDKKASQKKPGSRGQKPR